MFVKYITSILNAIYSLKQQDIANCIVLSLLPMHIQMTEWSQGSMGLIQQNYGMQK